MASILRINPVEHSLVIPNTGGDAKFNLAKLEWEASDFTVEISDSRQIGSSPDRSEVHFRSDVCLTVRYKTPKTTVEVLSELRALDDFLSVVSGSFVKLKAVWLEVLLNHPEENKAEFKLLGYDTGSIKDDFVARSEILAELPIKDNWAKRIENFLHEWLNNQIAFKWFRSSQTKRRYVEEVFFLRSPSDRKVL